MSMASVALLGAALTVALIVVAIKYAPGWLADTRHLNARDRAAELGRVRTAVLAALAGTVAVVGAEFTRRSYLLSRSGQITERFSRAVEHVGNEKVDVQVGGIFALERIAKDSAEDHQAVIELLSEFVRLNSHWTQPPGGDPCGSDGDEALPPYDEIRELFVFERPADRGAVQAAMTVIARREHRNDGDRQIDLRSSDLRRLDLHQARLARAKLSRSNFARAWLSEANLQSASMRESCLADAALERAHLEHARLVRASMRRAWAAGSYLAQADLRQCDLRDADLTNADLTDACLDSADLRGTILVGATLLGVSWVGAVWDDRTSWPAGFMAPGVARHVRDDGAASAGG